MRSLSIITITLCLSRALCSTIPNVKRDNITLAAPIVGVPSQHWEGIDGNWSTFEIRVGTPATTYRVLPTTSWQETWVVYAEALNVCNTSVGVSPTCQDARGGVFDDTQSSSWVNEEQGLLELNEGLGFEGVGQYGFDTVGLGYTNTTGPTLPHQIVSEIVSDSWWFGMLGLGFQPTNFTSYANPQPSFSSSLFSAGLISSMSWSYTAGAIYRLKGVFGSLVFGGYDAARFVENDVIFTMAPDNLRDLVVTIKGISSSANGGNGNVTLMSTPQFAFIDSSIPELWLPGSVCDAFAQTFNLSLDNSTGLYLVDPSAHNALLASDPNITIRLANQKTGGQTTDFVLPYAAFDLSIAPPRLANRTSYYFPIREGKDETQYALGRTFLQEAYVTAHYESRTFNVSQCVFEDPTAEQIIALPSVLYTAPVDPNPSANTTTPSTGSTNSKADLSTGGIVGIVIGVLALVIVLLTAIIVLRRRRTRAPSTTQTSEIDTSQNQGGKRTAQPTAIAANELPGIPAKFEKFGNPVMIPQELEAAPVSHRTPMVEIGEEEGGLSAAGTDVGFGSMSRRTPMVEIGEDEGGLSAVSEDAVVSPQSVGTSSGLESSNGRRTTPIPMRPQIVVSSSAASRGESPASPGRGSKFEEHL